MRWELYCRVIDNHGDLGVCWRLATQLAERGDEVRLWADDASALAWMAPDGHERVQVRGWSREPPADLGDVVVETFGCELPPRLIDSMAVSARPPMWINLEYLSAEPWVERSHGLPSPVRPGLAKWFFFPGFAPATGGLLRTAAECGRSAIDRAGWFASHGITPREGERVISLFCYPHAALAAWLPAMGAEPTLLLATAPVAELMRGLSLPTTLRLHTLPWLAQHDYDHLLGSCDLNAVRGEDSFAQAHWPQAPLLWHIYPQADGVHRVKLEAWLDRLLAGSAAAPAAEIRQAQLAWNGFGPAPARLPPLGPWRAAQGQLRQTLLQQDDLVTQLRRFVVEKASTLRVDC